MSSARQLNTLLDLGAQALDLPTEADWWPVLASTLTGSLFYATVVAVNVVNPVEMFGWFRLVYPLSARARMPINSPMDQVLTHDHPFSVQMRQAPVNEPVKVSDLVSDRQWRGLSAWERMRYLTGGTHHLIVHIPRPAPYVESVSIVRADRDFDASEMELAKQLQTVVQLSVRHLHHVERRRSAWGPLADGEAAVAAAALGISHRERSVLDLLAAGGSAGTIAAQLGLAVRTVYRHQHNLYRKLGASRGLDAVQRGRQLGLLPTVPVTDKLPRAAPALTGRERAVLDLLATGMTNRSIADTFMVSSRTVDVHVAAVLRKLDVRTRTEAVAYALRDGLVC